jgi:hypothetical protein
MINPKKLGKNMKAYRQTLCVTLWLVLLASITGCAGGGLSSQSAALVDTQPMPRTYQGVPGHQRVETPEVLEACATMPNSDLEENRGCYASYFFGMDVGINVSDHHNPGVSVRFHANVPDGSPAPSFSGNQVSFNDGHVGFQAGIGNTSLGSGIFQVTQVAGNNNLVVSSMNVNINIANATSLVPKINALSFTGIR